jgi:hypothetical protein
MRMSRAAARLSTQRREGTDLGAGADMPARSEATWEQVERGIPAVETPAAERTADGCPWMRLAIAALVAVVAVLAGVRHSADAPGVAGVGRTVSVAAVPAAE